MTQDEIIEMWKNSGDLDIIGMPYNKIEDFARLVYAKATEREREAILDLVDAYAKNNTDLADAIRARGNT